MVEDNFKKQQLLTGREHGCPGQWPAGGEGLYQAHSQSKLGDVTRSEQEQENICGLENISFESKLGHMGISGFAMG